MTVNSLQVTIYTTAYTAQSLSWSKPFSGIKILSSSYSIELGCGGGWEVKVGREEGSTFSVDIFPLLTSISFLTGSFPSEIPMHQKSLFCRTLLLLVP